jgi:hypothetical protein
MLTMTNLRIGGVLVALMLSSGTPAAQLPALKHINLTEQLASGKLRAVNRQVTIAKDRPGAVHVSEDMGNGLVWIEGTEFGNGTIELQVRGRDLFQRSFVGVAFHGRGDNVYEAVYLRPFNFRSDDAARHQHAVQYIALPDHDWPRLRKEFPEEFENPVAASVSPTEWIPLRVVVKGQAVQIYVGAVRSPTLEVRKLGSSARGQIGLWVGNASDGDFADVRVTPMD